MPRKFILKGALMLLVWNARVSRSTMDIDMLGRMKNNPEAILDMIRDICRQEVEPDGVVFDPDSVRGERITEEANYEGVRVRFRGALDTARIVIQLDVGFGDVVVPPPKLMTYPTILDLPAPQVRGYSRGEHNCREVRGDGQTWRYEQPHERFLGHPPSFPTVRFRRQDAGDCDCGNLLKAPHRHSGRSDRLYRNLHERRNENGPMEGLPPQEPDDRRCGYLRGGGSRRFCFSQTGR